MKKLIWVLIFWLFFPNFIYAHSTIYPQIQQIQSTQVIPSTPSQMSIPQQAQPLQFPQTGTVTPYQPPKQIEIKIFGEQLFTGRFATEQFTGFNPNYQISIGDKITLKIWGVFNYESVLTVDPQGNIFIPQVGPVRVLGVRNAELNEIVDRAIKRVFKQTIGVYATLETAVPVKVFVTGFVRNPGLYGGLSSNSVLYYIDQAGGIDPARGSFIDIKVYRNNKLRWKFNLYDFLLNGTIDFIQMADGDIIVVEPQKSTFSVSGAVYNPFIFEFEGEYIYLKDALKLAKPKPEATNVTITRKQGVKRYAEYYFLDQIEGVKVYNGDEISVLSDRYPGTIYVRIEGAHSGPHALILPYGAKLKDVLDKIVPNEKSNLANLQLFRASVAQRQKENILATLQQLKTYVLTSRSEVKEEAELRAREAELVMKFIETVKDITPKGQVIIDNIDTAKEMFLEDGDVINIPEKTSVVMVNGEVRFPNAIVYKPGADVDYYIKQAGGFTQRANSSEILVVRQNGKFANGADAEILPGDEIYVLPKVEAKNIEIVRAITQILSQIALTARVFIFRW